MERNRFYVGNKSKANAVRVATSSAESDQQLCQGLEVLREFIQKQEGHPV